MKTLKCLYVHYYTLKHAPKSWTKYIWFCLTHFRKPNVSVLSKIITLTKISRSLKTEHDTTVNTTNTKNLKALYYKC